MRIPHCTFRYLPELLITPRENIYTSIYIYIYIYKEKGKSHFFGVIINLFLFHDDLHQMLGEKNYFGF